MVADIIGQRAGDRLVTPRQLSAREHRLSRAAKRLQNRNRTDIIGRDSVTQPAFGTLQVTIRRRDCCELPGGRQEQHDEPVAQGLMSVLHQQRGQPMTGLGRDIGRQCRRTCCRCVPATCSGRRSGTRL
jgi:hypothetical protein